MGAISNIAADCRSSRLAAALHRAAAIRLCMLRADSGFAWYLRGDFVLGGAADARDRHSRGAGSFTGGAADILLQTLGLTAAGLLLGTVASGLVTQALKGLLF